MPAACEALCGTHGTCVCVCTYALVAAQQRAYYPTQKQEQLERLHEPHERPSEWHEDAIPSNFELSSSSTVGLTCSVFMSVCGARILCVRRQVRYRDQCSLLDVLLRQLL